MPAIAAGGQDNKLSLGTVISLRGTPHLWFADAQGVLHWGGDTRALAGRQISWSDRVEVSLEELKVLPIGDPWLSAGLLKVGNPIYLAKWETEWTEPKLLHIQSIGDVEIFGIDGSNYGNFVLGRRTWEAAHGFSFDALERSALAGASTPSNPMPPADPAFPLTTEAVTSRILAALQDDGDDDDDEDDNTATATDTATATATGAQTATATATATATGTDASNSVTETATDDTQNGLTATATDTATATATGAQTATATATATATGTDATNSVTNTDTDETPETVTVTDTDTDTDDTDGG